MTAAATWRLYRIDFPSDAAAYVGVTRLALADRVAQHRQARGRWANEELRERLRRDPHRARTIARFDDRRAALDAEAAAVAALLWPLNRAGITRPRAAAAPAALTEVVQTCARDYDGSWRGWGAARCWLCRREEDDCDCPRYARRGTPRPGTLRNRWAYRAAPGGDWLPSIEAVLAAEGFRAPAAWRARTFDLTSTAAPGAKIVTRRPGAVEPGDAVDMDGELRRVAAVVSARRFPRGGWGAALVALR